MLPFVYALLLGNLVLAQDAPKQMNGTVVKIDPAAGQLVMKADAGGEMTVTLGPKHALRKVALGETDLRKAAVIEFKDIAVGDRVAARGAESADQKSIAASLIVVMSSSDVAKKHAEEEEEWAKGVNGTVTAVGPQSVTVTTHTLQGTKTVTVTPEPKADIRRYTADSVKFAEAKASTLAEVKVGDQLRARGERSDDGSKLAADEMVSGTFKTIAGTVVSIDPAAKQMTVKDLESKKTVTVKINAESNVKRLSDPIAQMIARRVHPENFEGDGRGGRGGRSGGGAPPEGGAPQGGGMRGGGGRGGDLQSILEKQPAITLADLKVGEPVVIASTVGAADHITAITMLAGVEPILRSPGKPEMSLGGWSLGAGGGEGGN
jgi:uncharacterized membrane protein YgcG